jgi:hypothetical protein
MCFSLSTIRFKIMARINYWERLRGSNSFFNLGFGLIPPKCLVALPTLVKMSWFVMWSFCTFFLVRFTLSNTLVGPYYKKILLFWFNLQLMHLDKIIVDIHYAMNLHHMTNPWLEGVSRLHHKTNPWLKGASKLKLTSQDYSINRNS